MFQQIFKLIESIRQKPKKGELQFQAFALGGDMRG